MYAIRSYYAGTCRWRSWWRGWWTRAARRSSPSRCVADPVPLVLLRVDERLIHGQVVLGWGSALRPDRYIVVVITSYSIHYTKLYDVDGISFGGG